MQHAREVEPDPSREELSMAGPSTPDHLPIWYLITLFAFPVLLLGSISAISGADGFGWIAIFVLIAVYAYADSRVRRRLGMPPDIYRRPAVFRTAAAVTAVQMIVIVGYYLAVVPNAGGTWYGLPVLGVILGVLAVGGTVAVHSKARQELRVS
jgi:hypothetical protein